MSNNSGLDYLYSGLNMNQDSTPNQQAQPTSVPTLVSTQPASTSPSPQSISSASAPPQLNDSSSNNTDSYHATVMQKEGETVNNILRAVINNTELTDSIGYIEDILQPEDFIIYNYAKLFYKSNAKVLKREALASALKASSHHWFEKNSIIRNRHKSKVLTIDELVAKVSDTDEKGRKLTNEDKLTILVLNKYDLITKNNQQSTEDELKSYIVAYKEYARENLAEDVLSRSFTLLGNTVDTKSYINNVSYTPRQTLEFIRDLAIDSIAKIDSISQRSNKSDMLSDIYEIATAISASKVIFEWQLYKNSTTAKIMSDPMAGQLISISAPPKQGKTRFVIGEMVYPTIMKNENVIYYSGEMTKIDIMTLLIIKHIHTISDGKIKFSSSNSLDELTHRSVRTIIQIVAKQQMKRLSSKISAKLDLTKEEKDFLNKWINNSTLNSIFGLVMEVYNCFMMGKDTRTNKDIGRIKVITKGSKADDDPEKDAFTIEEFDHFLMSYIRENEAYGKAPDLVVFDHAGHFESSDPRKSATEVFKTVYAKGKEMANNDAHPFLITILNHTRTTENDEKSGDDQTGNKYNAFGTSEAGKSADLDITLVSTPDDDRAGKISLVINFDRWSDTMQTLSTNTVKLSANKGVCDFNVVTSK